MPISFKQERGWGRGGVRSWSVSQVPGCESTRVSCAHFLFSLFSVFVFASFSPFLGPFLLWHLQYFPSHQHEKVSSVRVLGSVMQCIVSASWDTPWALPLPPSLSPRLPVSLSLLGGLRTAKCSVKGPGTGLAAWSPFLLLIRGPRESALRMSMLVGQLFAY